MIESTASDNSPAYLHAKAWAEEYELIDRQLSPLGLRAMQELQIAFGETVLDIGCGTGQTLLQLADRVGEQGSVYGVDISGRLLKVARERTSHLQSVRLIEADAQTLDFSDRADAIFSRFGVMSFSDPVGTFSNFYRLMKPEGRLAFCCWRALQENELDRFPLVATGFETAADGTPFSLSDPRHVRTILTSAGFKDISIQPHDELVTSGGIDAMTRVLMKVGPLGKIVRERPSLSLEVEPKLRMALRGLGEASDVALIASMWIVTARV